MTRRRASSANSTELNSTGASNNINLTKHRKYSRLNTNQKNSQTRNDIINKLLDKIYHSRDKLGKTPLHASVCSKSDFGVTLALLETSTDIDNSLSDKVESSSKHDNIRKLILAKDEESGYTALHLAVLSLDLRSILLLLRFAIMDEMSSVGITISTSTFSSSSKYLPINLLEGERSNDAIWENLIWNELVHSRDNDGSRAIDLLGQLNISNLRESRRILNEPIEECFLKLRRNYRSHSNSFGSNSRRRLRSRGNSFASFENSDADAYDSFEEHEHEHENENEFFMLSEDLDLHDNEESIIRKSVDDQKKVDFGCEVLTFGQADHCALGVPNASTRLRQPSAESNYVMMNGNTATRTLNNELTHCRPRRVRHFAIRDMGCENSALAIAAAAHHTMVLTKKGELYTFGLGKGGRLGVGDEVHRPLPTRVLGALKNKKVVSISASTNHSLCCTSEGNVYAWGSNRYGQLGVNSSSIEERYFPRRVEELCKKVNQAFVIRVAAGDKHSLAMTAFGEVYSWGDNKLGQLGTGATPSSSFTPPTRVELTSTRNHTLRKRVIAIDISASESSSLALCKIPQGNEDLASNRKTSRVNSVFVFGNGTSFPLKVNFPPSKNGHHVIPVGIACARYHNVVITAEGQVFTWGFHSDPLGTNLNTKNSSVLPVPQLVTKMLPKNGGGRAVAVSASEHHTAVLTEEGYLYTWGATTKNQIMGHDGVKYQALPKKVPGVYRAVSVAVAKEHTVLLVATNKPQEESVFKMTTRTQSLQNLASFRMAQHVDLFNVLAIFVIAERLNSPLLLNYCKEFVRLNMDGVLAYSKVRDLELFLHDAVKDGRHNLITTNLEDEDRYINPLLMKFLMENIENDVSYAGKKVKKKDWSEICSNFYLNNTPDEQGDISLFQTPPKNKNYYPNSFYTQNEGTVTKGKESNDSENRTLDKCSDWCRAIIEPADKLVQQPPSAVKEFHGSITNAIRSTKKKLSRVNELEKSCSSKSVKLSEEQHTKLTRKPILERDLDTLLRIHALVEKRMIHFNLYKVDSEKTTSPENVVDVKVSAAEDSLKDMRDSLQESIQCYGEKDAVTYKCLQCNIICPDETSYELHLNGRKHRNKLKKIEEEERTAAALKIMEQQLKQSFSSMTPTKKQSRTDINSTLSSKSNLPVAWSTPPASGALATKSATRSFQQILKEEEYTMLQKQAQNFPPQRELNSSRNSAYTPSKSPWKKEKIVATNLNIKTESLKSDSATSMPLAAYVTPSKKTNPCSLTKIGKKSEKKHSASEGTLSTPRHATSKTPWSNVMNISVSHENLGSKSEACTKSLTEIQREEMESTRVSCASSKWYVPQRERSGSESFDAILNEQKLMQQLVEEQYAIESHIYEQLELERKEKQNKEKNQGKKDKHRKERKNRKINQNSHKSKSSESKRLSQKKSQ